MYDLWPYFLTDVIQISIGFRDWTSKYIYMNSWYVVTSSCRNFEGELDKSLPDLGRQLIITSVRKYCSKLFMR